MWSGKIENSFYEETGIKKGLPLPQNSSLTNQISLNQLNMDFS
jgi:hypothetical protein